MGGTTALSHVLVMPSPHSLAYGPCALSHSQKQRHPRTPLLTQATTYRQTTSHTSPSNLSRSRAFNVSCTRNTLNAFPPKIELPTMAFFVAAWLTSRLITSGAGDWQSAVRPHRAVKVSACWPTMATIATRTAYGGAWREIAAAAVAICGD